MDDLFQNNEVPQYLQELNPQQREAVRFSDGPILVLAGAGSGKTRVLTNRIAHLVLGHNVNPANIMAVTFTNKAAGEMKERLKKLLGDEADKIWASTFHSAALKILRRHAISIGYPTNNFIVFDDNDSKSLIKRIMKELYITDKKLTPNYFLSIIDKAKNNNVSPEEFAKRSSCCFKPSKDQAPQVYTRYQQELLNNGAMDFGDLLMNVVKLFNTYPELLDSYQRFIHYLLVDEFQDTNVVQYLFIKQITKLRKNIFVVGDDDQSIYAFRGANISNILNFEKDFPNSKVVTLEQNYRSTQNILDVAYSVISKNKERKEKKLWTSAKEGNKIITFRGDDEDEEALFVANEIIKQIDQNRSYSDIAIFYRTNAQSRALEEALLKCHIPYRIYGGLKFYERKEIKDILAYLRLLINEKDSQSFLRAINTPPRGIGEVTLKKIADQATSQDISLWESAVILASTNSKIKEFVELVEHFKTLSKKVNLGDLIKEIVSKTGYSDKIQNSKEIGNISRIENINELISLGRASEKSGETYESALQTFLDKVSLTSGDDMSTNEKNKIDNDSKSPAVSLMTLHLAKGLEFPIVFFTGLEEGLVPHHLSLNSESEIAEERRLCYVGITRAKELLYLTNAESRGMFNSGGAIDLFTSRFRLPSRFLSDIPAEYLENKGDKSFSDPKPSPIFDDTKPHWEEDDYSSVYNEYGGWQKKKKKISISRETDFLEDEYAIPPRFLKKEKKSESSIKKNLANIISVADANLYEIPEDAQLLKDHIDKAVTGLKVLHANFGEGTIIDMEIPASKDPNKTKIKVMFDQLGKEKTLLLGKARLAIVE